MKTEGHIFLSIAPVKPSLKPFSIKPSFIILIMILSFVGVV